MLSKRIIPCLDVRDGRLTKGIKFKGNVDIGDPVETAAQYYKEGADEIVFYDITASSERRDIMIETVRHQAVILNLIFVTTVAAGNSATLGEYSRLVPPPFRPSAIVRMPGRWQSPELTACRELSAGSG